MTVFVNTSFRKLCHAKVGDQIRLLDAETGAVLPEVFVVIALAQSGRRPARKGMMQGLYDEQRELWLVSLETGEARKMPHLSSRVDILHEDARVALGLPPVLTPQKAEGEERWVRLTLQVPRGKQCVRELNLADAGEVEDLLSFISRRSMCVCKMEIIANPATEQRLFEQWQAAVLTGQTKLGFDDFKRQS